MAKNKMSNETKVKLIYSGELLIISIVFIVVATLKVLHIMGSNSVMKIVFNVVTLIGGTWMILDFILSLTLKFRRKKTAIIDKILLLPLGFYLITFDIICFAKPAIRDTDTYLYMVVGAFYYLAVIYIFESIYHYFKPIPTILTAIEEIKNAERQDDQPEENLIGESKVIGEVEEEKPEEAK